MNKLFRYLFILSICTIGVPAYAQMMGNPASTADTAQTTQDEAAGKAVWDKLQNKQVTCADLTDDDFDVLGDFFMGNMMESNHASMNTLMAQRLGDAGEKQMHITMGKRLSGCDVTAPFPPGASYFTPMMGSMNMLGNTDTTSWQNGRTGMTGYRYGNMMKGGSFGIFGVTTWAAALVFLLSGSIFFWKGIQKRG